MEPLDDEAQSCERRPGEDWLAHQQRLAHLAYVAERLGPGRGAEMLRRVWAAAEYRDVHWQIARLVVAWGAGSLAFLRDRLADDPSRAIGILVQAWSYGAAGLESLVPDLRALESSLDHEVADAAADACVRLAGERD